MKIQYVKKRLPPETLAYIEKVNEIIDRYVAQGYTLTLRQVYYQLVSENYVGNSLKEYKRLVVVLTHGRLGGLIDWDAIVDMTRVLRGVHTWPSPAAMLREDADRFRIDKWSLEYGQDVRPEVWVEKDALRGLIEYACSPLFVDYFSCRGYTSLRPLKDAGERLAGIAATGQRPVIIHVGDHDYSGVHMTDDVWKRLAMFAGEPIEVERIALNMDQVRRFRLPPQPGKHRDSRRGAYLAEHNGREDVWELDALKPDYLVRLIQNKVAEYRNERAWAEAVAFEEGRRTELDKLSNRWTTIQRYLKRLKPQEPKRKSRKAKRRTKK